MSIELDVSDIDVSQPVTVEVLEEEGQFAVLVALEAECRTPVLEFEGLTDIQSAIATELVESIFPHCSQID